MLQAVHGWSSTYERLVKSQKFFSSYLTQEDLSRLGRNYIEVGRLTEEFFPEHDIRLVAVSDNIDTAEGENELAPIRNLFNEWYARDISKKRRISNKIKGNAGEPMGPPPYGYKKDPDDPKRWVVDEEAAQVVRRIFRMTVDGYGTEQIATILFEEKVLMFISLVRKYTRARKLTPRMLNELIEKIEVFNAEKIDGVWEQRLRIHYNCVGVIEIPDLIPLPAPEVSVNTRKGVVVNYAPSTIAG